jgi:uncharacterized protein YjbI with pentapeptide repeats
LEHDMTGVPTNAVDVALADTPEALDTAPGSLDGGHADFLQTMAAMSDRKEAIARVGDMTARLTQETGRGLQLSEAPLAGLDLSGFDLRRANLNRAQLHGTDLRGCDLSEASLICPSLERTKFAGASLRGVYIHALAAQVCDFRKADLSGIADGTGALFHGCFFNEATITDAMLSGSSFYQTVFDGARFDGTNLQGCQFAESSAAGASWRDSYLDNAVFTRVDLSGGVFTGAKGADVVVQRPLGAVNVDLSGAYLTGLRLVDVKGAGLTARGLMARGADVRDCALDGSDFSGADFAESSWTRVCVSGASFERAAADNSRWLGCNLDRAVLAGLKAENITMIECSMRGGRLAGIQARCANIRNSVLYRADLANAYLYRAIITGDPPASMDLRECRLTNAVLVQAYIAANLSGADLAHAQLAYGRLSQSVLAGADLSGTHLFQCTAIKSDFTGARLAGVRPPLLADRCAGLDEALRSAVDPDAAALAAQVDDLRAALTKHDQRST